MSITSRPSDHDPDPAFPIRRFTVDEYHRMGESGVIDENDRVELLEGLIVPKMIHNPAHDATLELVDETLRRLLAAAWRVRIQSAISTADSEPEPDLIVVRGAIRDRAVRHPVPADIALVVEIAESSLARDRAKCRIYAAAAIPTYWIVNLVDAQIEVYSDPTGPGPSPEFNQRDIYKANQSLRLVIDGQPIGEITASDLLP